jgi:RES domain-containing protein
MRVYRLVREPYCEDLSGYGASLSISNRWNSKGTHLIYTASNRSLAFAEVYVHLRLSRIPSDMVMVTTLLPKNTKVVPVALEQDIRQTDLTTTQKLGDVFAANKFLMAMKVPSYVVQGESNILLNPAHKEMDKVTIEDIQPFKFDLRLL